MDLPSALLPRSPPLSSRRARRARERLRHTIVHVIAAARLERARAEGAEPLPPPRLQLAREYVRFLLPKGEDGDLLPLRCAESRFAGHVGAGVATYMQFVRLTCQMFAIATVLAAPQFAANFSGSRLGLAWPFAAAGRCASAYATAAQGGQLAQLIARVTAPLAWLLYASMLGNANLDADLGGEGGEGGGGEGGGGEGGGGWVGEAHLWGELALSSFFCLYTYHLYRRHRAALARIEGEAAAGARASDYAVTVSGLPASGVSPRGLRAHFAFFGAATVRRVPRAGDSRIASRRTGLLGEVASVAISSNNQRYVAALLELQRLRREWTHAKTRAVGECFPEPSGGSAAGASGAARTRSSRATPPLSPSRSRTHCSARWRPPRRGTRGAPPRVGSRHRQRLHREPRFTHQARHPAAARAAAPQDAHVRRAAPRGGGGARLVHRPRIRHLRARRLRSPMRAPLWPDPKARVSPRDRRDVATVAGFFRRGAPARHTTRRQSFQPSLGHPLSHPSGHPLSHPFGPPSATRPVCRHARQHGLASGEARRSASGALLRGASPTPHARRA